MQINVTRPVVVSTATGLRHFMPGLLVDIPQAEAEQILRQQAGSVVTLLDDASRKKNRPEKAHSAAIQAEPALLADASIMAASADFGGGSCGTSSSDFAGVNKHHYGATYRRTLEPLCGRGQRRKTSRL